MSNEIAKKVTRGARKPKSQSRKGTGALRNGLVKTSQKTVTKKPPSQRANAKSSFNDLQELQRFLIRAFDSARVVVEEPIAKKGVWSLDLFLPNYHLAVAWQLGNGFGLVSNDSHVYGEGAHEVFKDLKSVTPRIVELVSNRRPSIPPEAVKLKNLREARGISQEELARRLGSKQASVSRAEARSDFLLSTLKKYMEALGGTVVVKIVFPDGDKELRLE